MKLTIVSDNRAPADLSAEHGFSLFMEGKEGNYLLDAGKGQSFLDNFEKLGLTKEKLKGIISSHGHFDHMGNMSYLHQNYADLQLYGHPDILLQRYSIHPGEKIHKIGITGSNIEAIERLPRNQKHWKRGLFSLNKEIQGLTDIPLIEPVEHDFFLDWNGKDRDLLRDDLSLLVKAERGYSLICGCCHSGLKNTWQMIQNKLGEIPLYSIIGGFHLSSAPKSTLEDLAFWLNDIKVQRVVPCHCSGENLIPIWKDIFKGEVIQGYAGLKLDL